MRSRITEEGMELRDTISRLRWNETKRTIRVEERYVADRVIFSGDRIF